MRTTVVPAQVTTVEDRIAGNLTFSQVILLVFGLMVCAALYLGLEPQSRPSQPKLALMALQFALFGILSLRVGGKIVAEWLAVYSRYFSRPRIYVFTKNDTAGRLAYQSDVPKGEEIGFQEAPKRRAIARLSLLERSHISGLMDDPSLSIRFEPKKGGVDVSLVQLAE